MSVTVGEVNAILSARDNMTAVLQQAVQSGVSPLRSELKGLSSDMREFSQNQSGIWVPSQTASVQAGSQSVSELGAKMRSMGEDAAGAGSSTSDFSGKVDASVPKLEKASGMVAEISKSLAAYLTIARVVGAISDLVNQAKQVEELSQQLKVNTSALYAWEAAAKVGGGTMQDVAGAVTFMQRAIAGGDTSAIEALKEMGLSIDQLQQMRPAEAFTAIANAAGKIQDPIRQTDAVLSVFGRNAGVFLPSIRKGFDEVSASATKMPDDVHAALAQLSYAASAAGDMAKDFLSKAVAGWVLLYDKIVGDDPFNYVAQNATAAGEAVDRTIKLSEDSLSAIRRASADLEVVFASAGKEGLAAQAAAIEKRHELELQDIDVSVQTAEQRHVRLIQEEKRYSAELFQIKTDTAKELRALQEKVDAEVLASHTAHLDDDAQVELAAARRSASTVEEFEQAKLVIISKYAAERLNLQRQRLLDEERLAVIQATREAASEEDKQRRITEIQRSFDEQQRALAVASAAELYRQTEQLEQQHLQRMQQMQMTSSVEGAKSENLNTSPAEQSLTNSHNQFVEQITQQLSSALAQGLTDEAQRLQTILQEENERFQVAVANVRAGLDEFGSAVTSTAAASTQAATAIDTMAVSAQKSAQTVEQVWTVLSGDLLGDMARQTAFGDGFQGAANHYDAVVRGAGMAHFDTGGPVKGDGPIFAHDGEMVVPKNGMLVKDGGGSGPVTVNVSMSGMLLSSDPRAQIELGNTVAEIVERQVKSVRKMGTN